MKLDIQDLRWAIRLLPKRVVSLMQDKEWVNSIFIGGGYLRACIANEPINDIDIFVKSEKEAESLAYKLCFDKNDVFKTKNAYTIKDNIPIQIIHRWVFENPEDVSNSFDFTISCAIIYFDGINFNSFCDDRFYVDLAAKRLIYRRPKINEDAGGSMLRVLKYYQKGYRIPLDSLGDIIARLVKDIDIERCKLTDEEQVGKVITGLLREVDPNIDPLHQAHLLSSIDS